MKRKHLAVSGIVLCFMMMATFAWALPGVPNGTVTDGNLVWLQNGNCFGRQNWNQATFKAAGLKSGDCGLTDGSKAGDWRLPTKNELVRRAGNKQRFNDVQAYYWSSSSYASSPHSAWYVGMYDGDVNGSSKGSYAYVWPVRAKQ